MIPRALYRVLLLCHPPSFRRRFANEMLWIFDQAAGQWWLIPDAFVSLFRQWMWRTGALWKLPLIAAGGFLAPLLGLSLLPVLGLASNHVRIHSLQSLIILTTLCSMLVIFLTLILCVSWFRFIQKRRA